jgi:hypothetical protein
MTLGNPQRRNLVIKRNHSRQIGLCCIVPEIAYRSELGELALDESELFHQRLFWFGLKQAISVSAEFGNCFQSGF